MSHLHKYQYFISWKVRRTTSIFLLVDLIISHISVGHDKSVINSNQITEEPALIHLDHKTFKTKHKHLCFFNL